MNRCQNTGVLHPKPYLGLERSTFIRKKIDAFIDKKIEEWNSTVPFARHFEDKQINSEYYARHLIETALRIRLLRISESKAQAEVAKLSPEAAQVWAHYEYEEMIHDKLFMDDLERLGISKEVVAKTEPYLSTKLLTGFFNYILDHEGPLGVVVYSYLVEYVNVKLDPKKIEGLKAAMGEEKVKGQIAHSHTDVIDDHPGEVWNVIRYLVRSEDDIKSIYKYIDEHQAVLAMYFNEIYKDTVLGDIKNAG